MAQKTRDELKVLFKKGAKPTEYDFRDFIDSTLNQKDDGIKKSQGADTPLKITAQGTEENLLDFYGGNTHTWRINQKPNGETPGLNFSTLGSSRLFIEQSSGNVGISTDQPQAQLHIKQTGNTDALRIDDELTDTTPLVIKNDGDVGIGTTDPEEKLEVAGFLTVGNKGDNSVIKFKATNNKTAEIGVQNNDDQGFYVNTRGEYRLSVNQNGNIGIGTTEAKAKLHIENGKDVTLKDKESGYLILGSVNEKNIAIDNNEIMARNNSMPETLHIQAEGGDLVIYDQQSQGKITISPYHVMFGNMISITPVTGQINASIVHALLVNRSSDDRVKTNPKKLNKKQALEILDQLNFVDYEWIPEYCSGKKGRGIYAQEVRSLLPEAVSVSPEKILDNGEVVKDFLSVDYNWIFVTGMAAIQELKQQNEQLWEEIKHLKKVINSFPKMSRTEI